MSKVGHMPRFDSSGCQESNATLQDLFVLQLELHRRVAPWDRSRAASASERNTRNDVCVPGFQRPTRWGRGESLFRELQPFQGYAGAKRLVFLR
jgi:hypothetical protein